MTKEKNINASAEKDKFADDVLTEDELDNVAGGTGDLVVKGELVNVVSDTFEFLLFTTGK